MTSTQGAILTETAHLLALEAQEKLGALLEALGLCNVCCSQATGISQAAQHKNNELHPTESPLVSAPATLTKLSEADNRSTANLH